jgi:peptidoglycan/xylan/chitin deacetylase (PgdA/CDA1 family)
MTIERVVLQAVAAAPGGELDAATVASAPHLRPLVASFERLVVDVTGPDELVRRAADGLPEGPARAEAIAVRLRRRGVGIDWREPQPAANLRALSRTARAYGASSMAMARSDPSLVPELLVGSWFNADWRLRLVRRVLLALPPLPPARTRTGIRTAIDVAFWRGVRGAASETEWRRLTRSSYVALVYHRFAGELKQGQEKIDIAPRTFERQLRLLRRLGFRHLGTEELLDFHSDSQRVLPRRSFVVTVDDAVHDSMQALERHAMLGPQLFVPTAEVGGLAHWLDGEPVLSWDDIRKLAAAGVSIGAHARRHRRLSGLPPADLFDELAGARSDLRFRAGVEADVLTYPHGDHNLAVRRAALDAGYRAAFTTERGRNGAGTDVYCLRRASIHGADGRLAALWKVATGEALPPAWLRLRTLRRRLTQRYGA